MPDATRINAQFDGFSLSTLTYEGRPCWIAREIGRVLGYSRDGRRLPAKILGEWGLDLILGHDYLVLRGDGLAAFKAELLVGATGADPAKTQHSLVLLFEPGLHVVLARSSKLVSYRLRRFLLDEVLPLLQSKRRSRPSPRPARVHLVVRPGFALDDRMLREQRLLAQHELRQRMFQAASLRSTVRALAHLGRLTDDQVQVYEVLATEIALGLALPGLAMDGATDEDSMRDHSRLAEALARISRDHNRAVAEREAQGDSWPLKDRDERDAADLDDPTP